ncbi:MAG TPA: copper resistance protein CopC [Solirubrobacteraceae bacterium]
MRRAVLIAFAALALLPASASAHAQLEGTTPARGAVVKAQPPRVVFAFSEGVEAPPGAVRVFDRAGQRVDDGAVAHPGGDGAKLAVGLKRGLPDGTYTATYRVISADGHPVSGGLVFSVGKPGAGSSRTIDELIGGGGTSSGATAVQRVANALQYLATALAVGFLVFVLLCWRAGLQAPRARRLLLGATALGVVASVAGILAQADAGGGVGFVLDTRFGEVWGARTLVWLAFGAAAMAATRGGSRRSAALLAAPATLLTVAPALEGHSTTIGSAPLLIALDVLHVLAMSAWLGGLVALLFVVTGDRAPVLARFSWLALVAVATLAVTGTVAAISLLTALDQLWDTGYGRELLAKIALLAVLIGLGFLNRRRLAGGRTVRDVIRAEVVLILTVLGISGVLVDGVPPVSAASGPFSASKRLGPLQLELTSDAGQLHLYLFRGRDGAPFTGTKELRITARLRDVGPLRLTPRRAGPGHFTADALQLSPLGDWRLRLDVRVSDFDQYTTTLEVPIR